MKVSASMLSNDEFSVNSWWASSPKLILETLQKQLDAASAIWPELSQYKIVKKRSKVAPPDAGDSK